MKLSHKEKETLGFYTLESLLAFIAMVVVFGMFIHTEDLLFLVIELILGAWIVLNDLRSKI